MTEPQLQALRESIIHQLRSRGWSRTDAEGAADEKIDALRFPRLDTKPDNAGHV